MRINPETLEPRFKVIGHEAWIEPRAAPELPAEGRATGICGSGIIEAVAEMFLAGIIAADGRFDEAAAKRSPRVRFEGRTGIFVLADAAQTATGKPVVVSQSDVRAIQLAKAALYAGVKLLMQHKGVSRVQRIAMAGAFGSYIDPLHAMVLGMIPDCDLSRVVAVGNAAGDGARIALLNRDQRLEAERLAGAGSFHVKQPPPYALAAPISPHLAADRDQRAVGLARGRRQPRHLSPAGDPS